MQFIDQPTAVAQEAVCSLSPIPFWLDDADRPGPMPALGQSLDCDLLVVGGGFSGLWTALLAKQQDPSRSVLLVEGGRIAEGGSGRNGGFVSHSLTHGIGNGLARWPEEMPTLLRLGYENLAGIAKAVADLGIDCGFRQSGDLVVAVADHQVDDLIEGAGEAAGILAPCEFLDKGQVQSLIHSPTYLAGLSDPEVGLVNPARLAWGLAEACNQVGVHVHESSPVKGLRDAGERVEAVIGDHTVRARRVALATNAFPPLVADIRRRVVPVYDYVIVTEPLTSEQWASLGWDGRQGVSDAGNQFHYYRPTDDGRILWGGYDAVYHSGNAFGSQYEVDQESFARLATHFQQTFPQLEGLGFTHGWGGAIDTCSRFAPFWGHVHSGKTAYVAGYTGLGVGSSRFGAQVMLDLLDGRTTERTELQMVRTKPMPFPPEPIRSIAIGWTVASLQAADRNAGRRNLWLRALDRLGLGFDS
jgi:glycine/D-amino acid oxidase-like deaminating enzyme